MTVEPNLTPEEIQQFRKLLEIEKIRKKKQLYCHLLDNLQFEEWAQLFAEDVVAEWGPSGSWRGRSQVYEKIKEFMGGQVPYYTMHMTTNLWIELTSPTTAMSRTYLHDIANNLDPRVNPLNYLAVYEEDWAKIDGDWKITRHYVQFLWPERTATADFPRPMAPTSIG